LCGELLQVDVQLAPRVAGVEIAQRRQRAFGEAT